MNRRGCDQPYPGRAGLWKWEFRSRYRYDRQGAIDLWAWRPAEFNSGLTVSLESHATCLWPDTIRARAHGAGLPMRP